MNEHQKRVLEERNQLHTRIQSLTVFLNSDTYAALWVDERVKLKLQHTYMCLYLNALNDRIKDFII